MTNDFKDCATDMTQDHKDSITYCRLPFHSSQTCVQTCLNMVPNRNKTHALAYENMTVNIILGLRHFY